VSAVTIRQCTAGNEENEWMILSRAHRRLMCRSTRKSLHPIGNKIVPPGSRMVCHAETAAGCRRQGAPGRKKASGRLHEVRRRSTARTAVAWSGRRRRASRRTICAPGSHTGAPRSMPPRELRSSIASPRAPALRCRSSTPPDVRPSAGSSPARSSAAGWPDRVCGPSPRPGCRPCCGPGWSRESPR
jgi:hypothetical protein